MKDPYLQRADEVFAIEMEALEAVRQSWEAPLVLWSPLW